MFAKKKLFSLLFFSLFLIAHAQIKRDTSSLKVIFAQIAAQYNIKFDYIEEEIIIYQIAPPKANMSLSEKIAYIESQTRLKVKKISNAYYSVYNDKKLDKPLCGYLLDSVMGVPVENATIKVLNNNITVFSNQNGYFELPLLLENDIEISHINFEKKVIAPIELYVSGCPKIKLVPIVQKLEEVITNQYLTSGIYKKEDGNIEIKPRKFGILPGLIEPDVLQTLQQIPGISSVNETVSNINIRGGTHDQNLFLWNGIRMFQTGHFFGLISAFNPSLAQTITVVKNGSSAFYGESVSSVIDISSHFKSIEKTRSSISSNLISAEFYSKIKVSDKCSFTISGRRSLTDIFSSPTYRNYRNTVFQNTVVTNLNNNQIIDVRTNEKFYFYDFTSQYQQKIGTKHTLNADAIVLKNSLFINQSTTNESKKSDLGQESLGATISWKTNWNNKNSSQMYCYSSKYSLVCENESLQTNQILKQENKLLNLGFQLKNSHQITKSIQFNNGYQFDEIGVTNFDEINLPFFSRKSIEVQRTQSLITEGIFQTENKKTSLKAGIRVNHYDKFNMLLVEPRLQFNRALSETICLEIQGEQKSQTLSQVIDLQNDFLGIEKRRWILANGTSNPIEKSNQISVGLTFKKNNWLLTMDHFYKKVSGITTRSQGFQNQFEFVKTMGDYRVLGSEFLIQKNFGKFYSWLSYSYNDNKYFFKALQPTTFINNFEIKHSISWAGIYEWKNVKFALGCKWHSGKPITRPISTTVDAGNQQIVYYSPNNDNLNDFFQINFSASKNWKVNDKISLETNVSVLNILNKKNSVNRFYRINSTSNTLESVNTYALELTPNANVKLNF